MHCVRITGGCRVIALSRWVERTNGGKGMMPRGKVDVLSGWSKRLDPDGNRVERERRSENIREGSVVESFALSISDCL